MPANLPTKMKNDAIVEALLEIQFESDDIGEIVIGRLSDADEWNGYSTNRLNSANIPENIREKDPGLRFQPVIERRAQDGTSTARIGSHVLSYHVYAPYSGWKNFEPKLTSIIELLFNKTTNLRVSRLGFRYINFLQSGPHNLSGLTELSLKIQLQDAQLNDDINLAYQTKPTHEHNVTLRVASPNFINADIRPKDLVCVADVDVFTPEDFSVSDKKHVIQWMKDAHEIEKSSFFSLFTKEKIIELTVE